MDAPLGRAARIDFSPAGVFAAPFVAPGQLTAERRPAQLLGASLTAQPSPRAPVTVKAERPPC